MRVLWSSAAVPSGPGYSSPGTQSKQSPQHKGMGNRTAPSRYVAILDSPEYASPGTRPGQASHKGILDAAAPSRYIVVLPPEYASPGTQPYQASHYNDIILDGPIPSKYATVPCSGPMSPTTVPSSFVAVPSCVPSDLGTWTQQGLQYQGMSNKVSVSKLSAATGKRGRSVLLKSLAGTHSLIKETAVAAGARIAPYSSADLLFESAQPENIIQIRPGEVSMFKMLIAGVTKSLPTNILGCHPKVHFIRIGVAPPTYTVPS